MWLNFALFLLVYSYAQADPRVIPLEGDIFKKPRKMLLFVLTTGCRAPNAENAVGSVKIRTC